MQSQVGTRAGTCERGVALWRLLMTMQEESDELKLRVRRAREVTMARLELMYKPELSTLPPDERRDLLIALEALTDFESWARMREQYGLGVDEASAVWTYAIDRLLPSTPVHG